MFIALKIATFISNEYENRNFRDIIITKRRENDDESFFYIVNYINVAYFFSYYVFLFFKQFELILNLMIS